MRRLQRKKKWTFQTFWALATTIGLVTAALIVFANDAWDLRAKITATDNDATESPLAVVVEAKPLAGYSTIKDVKPELYPQGIVLRLNIGKRLSLTSTASITSVKVKLRNFRANAKLEYPYSLDPTRAPGLGPAPVECWNVVLRGNDVPLMTWTTGSGASVPIPTATDDLMATNPPISIQLGGSHQDSQDLEINIGTGKQGLYELCIEVNYIYLGRRFSMESETFRIYKK
jgi:hypothetical protein